MSFLYPFRATLVLASLVFACDFPVDDSKYEVDDSFNRIVEAFADDNQSCEECFSGCVAPIDECVATEGCTEFAECVRAEANPAGQATCQSQMVDVPFPVTVAYTAVVYCWMGCKSRCGVGSHWDCLDGYNVTQLPRRTAKVQQSFSYLCEDDAVQGAEVTFCDNEEHCRNKAVTDQTGTYTVDLPTNQNAPLAGWDGFRRVVGEGLAVPHRLERNLPIWNDQVETTRLMSPVCLAASTYGLKQADDSADWESAIAVQLFDCHTSGAEGVVLEVTTAPNARILYTTSNGLGISYVEGSSSASGDGSALIGSLPAGEHELVAWETTSRRRVGTAHVTVTPGDVIMYSLLPAPSE